MTDKQLKQYLKSKTLFTRYIIDLGLRLPHEMRERFEHLWCLEDNRLRLATEVKNFSKGETLDYMVENTITDNHYTLFLCRLPEHYLILVLVNFKKVGW